MKPASVLLVVLLSAATASVCAAQANGVPASVTSFGFGGNPNAAPGIPASVTSVGPRGFGSTASTLRFFGPGAQPANGNFHHHHDSDGDNRNNGFFNGYVPIYSYGGYYPGYAPVIVAQPEESAAQVSDAQVDDEEEAGPTVFEHRRSHVRPSEEAYNRGYEEGVAAAEDVRNARRVRKSAAERDQERAAERDADRDADHDKSDAKPDSKSDAKGEDQPAPAVEVKTVLVYKDNHKEEVANFAIVGDSLYDFTNGRRKIAVADLDVPATVKANDERGVDFQLPAVRAKK